MNEIFRRFLPRRLRVARQTKLDMEKAMLFGEYPTLKREPGEPRITRQIELSQSDWKKFEEALEMIFGGK
jgi:hypothetical protein